MLNRRANTAVHQSTTPPLSDEGIVIPPASCQLFVDFSRPLVAEDWYFSAVCSQSTHWGIYWRLKLKLTCLNQLGIFSLFFSPPESTLTDYW